MADLADMIQKLAFYESGGRDPGGYTLDKINAGAGIVDKTISDVLAIKKANLDRQKTTQEMSKLAQEAESLRRGNTPMSNYMTSQTVTTETPVEGPPLPDFKRPVNVSYRTVSGIDRSKLTPEELDKLASEDLKRAQAEYYRSGQKGGNKLYVNLKTRDVSEIPQPGYVEVSANTGAVIGTGPAKEAAITGRQKEMERVNVEPSVKLRYNDFRRSLRLAHKLQEGFNYAIANNIDVTGLLNYPIAKFKEYVGTLPPERQRVLNDLRTNFALFGRQMGGTAFTPTEKQIFAPIMPEVLLPTETNLNRILSVIEELEGRIADEEETSPGLKELFGVSGGQDVPPPGGSKKITLPDGTVAEVFE